MDPYAELRACCQPEPDDGPFATEVKRTLLGHLPPDPTPPVRHLWVVPDAPPEDQA